MTQKITASSHKTPKLSRHAEDTASQQRARKEKLAVALKRNLLRRKGKKATASPAENT